MEKTNEISFNSDTLHFAERVAILEAEMQRLRGDNLRLSDNLNRLLEKIGFLDGITKGLQDEKQRLSNELRALQEKVG